MAQYMEPARFSVAFEGDRELNNYSGTTNENYKGMWDYSIICRHYRKVVW
jgi:hypothetical protein